MRHSGHRSGRPRQSRVGPAETAENPIELLTEYDRLAGELERLIGRINVTNLATEIEPAVTLTEGLARRDVLRLRHRMHAELADSASTQLDRFTRTELRSVAAVDVRELRARADELARQYRELDTRIQQVNWTAELTE